MGKNRTMCNVMITQAFQLRWSCLLIAACQANASWLSVGVWENDLVFGKMFEIS